MADHTSYSQTAGRALELLLLFQKHEKLALHDVVKETGLSTTVAYRLLYTLTEKGFLKQDPGTKAYSLGRSTLILGYRAMKSMNIRDLARPLLQQLTKKTGLESFLNVCVDKKSLCLYRVSNGEDLQTSFREGDLAPLHKGATNRIILAFLPKEEILDYVAERKLAGENVDDLRWELAEIRRRGFDYSEGQLSRGLFSVAYPVWDINGRIAASISVSGPDYTITEELKEQHKEEVKLVAGQLSRLLGAFNPEH